MLQCNAAITYVRELTSYWLWLYNIIICAFLTWYRYFISKYHSWSQYSRYILTLIIRTIIRKQLWTNPHLTRPAWILQLNQCSPNGWLQIRATHSGQHKKRKTWDYFFGIAVSPAVHNKLSSVCWEECAFWSWTAPLSHPALPPSGWCAHCSPSSPPP